MVTGTPCHQVWFRTPPLTGRSAMHGDWNPLSSGRALPLTARSVMHGDWNPVSSGVAQSSSSGREVSHAR